MFTNSKTKNIAIYGLGAALYFVLSLTMKIPLIGNITIDAGYIALMVYCYLFGPWAGIICGAIGCALESILMSAYGFSIGWFAMNIIVAFLVGLIAKKNKDITQVIAIILLGVFLGVTAKTIIECYLYSIPLMVKLPKSAVAFVVDSTAMIIGYPIARKIENRVEN